MKILRTAYKKEGSALSRVIAVNGYIKLSENSLHSR